MTCKQQKFISQSFAVHQYLRYGTTMIKYWWEYYSSLQMGYFLISSSYGRKALRELFDVFLREAPILFSWIKPYELITSQGAYLLIPLGYIFLHAKFVEEDTNFCHFLPSKGYFCWYNLVSFYFIALSWPLIRSLVCIEILDYLSSCELLSVEPKL